MGFDIFGGLRRTAEGFGSVGDAFGAAQRAREAERDRASAELAQKQLEGTLTFIKGLGSQTPEQADRARQQILDSLNATTGAQIQLGDAAARNTIAATDAAGRVRKDLIGTQFSNTRALLDDQRAGEKEMAELFVNDLAERASRETEANRGLARYLAGRLDPEPSILGQVGQVIAAALASFV